MQSWMGYALTLFLTIIGIYLLSELDFFPIRSATERETAMSSTITPTESCSVVSINQDHLLPSNRPQQQLQRRRRRSSIWDEMGESDAFREIWNLALASRDFRFLPRDSTTTRTTTTTRLSDTTKKLMVDNAKTQEKSRNFVTLEVFDYNNNDISDIENGFARKC